MSKRLSKNCKGKVCYWATTYLKLLEVFVTAKMHKKLPQPLATPPPTPKQSSNNKLYTTNQVCVRLCVYIL